MRRWCSQQCRTAARSGTILTITIQNKCLRAITGSYKATNVHMLEHEVSIEPLNLHLEKVAVTHALRSADTECCRAIVHACDAQASQRLNIRIKRPIPELSDCGIEDKGRHEQPRMPRGASWRGRGHFAGRNIESRLKRLERQLRPHKVRSGMPNSIVCVRGY
jgi:hypothetical protein